MKTIAIIPARGGSKGIPYKNIAICDGKPLIAWTIEAALQASCIDEIYVSTEDSKISLVALEYGAKIIERPIELAQDLTTTYDSVIHALKYLKFTGKEKYPFFLLQATSPLRKGVHIDEAYNIYRQIKNAKGVISVCASKPPNKAYKINQDGSISGFISDASPYLPRQTFPFTCYPNGAIYLSEIKAYFEASDTGFPVYNVYPYFMDDKISYDIDNHFDLDIVNCIMKKYKNL